eukprot:Gb_00326 [translate_table: standard]
MASRVMSRFLVTSARTALHSSRNSFGAAGERTASSTARTSFSGRRNPFGNSANFRRRHAESSVPLHNAVAAAKLISHLSVGSRSCSALSLEDKSKLRRYRTPSRTKENCPAFNRRKWGFEKLTNAMGLQNMPIMQNRQSSSRTTQLSRMPASMNVRVVLYDNIAHPDNA